MARARCQRGERGSDIGTERLDIVGIGWAQPRNDKHACEDVTMQRRVGILLISVAVGVMFAGGLFYHGRVGGGLLLVTDAVLLALAMSSWGNTRPQGRPVRLAIIVLIAVIAIIKLVK
jgi:hypothetical protein